MGKKLILFDIDGTLIYHVGARKWEEQYLHGLEMAYNVKTDEDLSKYNGSVERDMAWKVVRKLGISRRDFLKSFPAYVEAMYEHLNMWGKQGPVFRIIPDALALVQKLYVNPDYILGILTGNAKRTADWKLAHTGLKDYFSFGLYGEEADDRISLAKLVFLKARKELHRSFLPDEIFVIGDTVHDIRCGKAIGARTIAVMTGMHGEEKILMAEDPDLLVTSLTDQSVLSLFSIK